MRKIFVPTVTFLYFLGELHKMASAHYIGKVAHIPVILNASAKIPQKTTLNHCSPLIHNTAELVEVIQRAGLHEERAQ